MTPVPDWPDDMTIPIYFDGKEIGFLNCSLDGIFSLDVSDAAHQAKISELIQGLLKSGGVGTAENDHVRKERLSTDDPRLLLSLGTELARFGYSTD